MTVPEGYVGLVLQTDPSDRLSERSELNSRLVKKVSDITVWNYDVKSDTADDNPISRAMKWGKLAKIMHQDD